MSDTILETILIVDDEDSVRRTFHEWLTQSDLPITVYAVPDAEAALVKANEEPIDLAILDWNLGSGSDGLRLLEDLVEFHPDIVAILVTGFANQATPLDALRMGVRDYLDKNQNLTREVFLAVVAKQLAKIAPAKRQRQLNQSLATFRESVEKVLPLVRASAALNDPLPLPDAVRSLFRFLLRGTGATDGVLIVRNATNDDEVTRIYSVTGDSLPSPTIPFSRTLAASVVSFQDPCIMNAFDPATIGPVELHEFEKNRRSVLAVSLRIAPGIHVVLEMFDKPEFTDEDRRITSVAAELGTEMLRQAFAERQTHRMLFDAVEAALQASASVSTVIQQDSPPAAVLERLKSGLDRDANAVIDSATGLQLVEAVRVLAVRHGSDAVRHCTQMVESLRDLLDRTTGGPLS
jgi:two-component system, NtrC family, nitrogen regulation response regulator NtrX